MELSGEITKKNEELSYGFVSVKGSEDVFFSPDTAYSGTNFDLLKIGDKVKVEAKTTDRGLFATSLSTALLKRPSSAPEASI